jgi:hypothetical protein
MGREKRAAQNRAQEMMEKTGRSSDIVTGAAAAASTQAVPQDQAATSTGKAIVEIILLYLAPILIILVIGKVFLKL